MAKTPTDHEPLVEQSAGPFSSWLHETRRARKLKVVGSNVPCGECLACCRASMFIHVRPEETDALSHIPRKLLFPAPGAPKGHLLLGFNEKGECPMLRDDRCSIYEHRPQTCRDFDCRVFPATGISIDEDGPQAEIARRAGSWRFELTSDEERAELTAVQATATFLAEQRSLFPEGALPHSPVQLAVLAVDVYEVLHQRVTGLPLPRSDHAQVAREVLAALDKLRVAAPRPRRKPR